MAIYDDEIAALADPTSGQTLAEAGGVGHAEVETRQNDALREVAGYLDAAELAAPRDLTPIMIVETAAGVWSGDAPAGRTGGQNPCWFLPFDPDAPTNPADGTDGIATPVNLRSWDILGPTTLDAL